MIEPLDGDFLFGDGENFIFREVASVNLLFLHLVIEIRIAESDTLTLCFQQHHAEKLEKLVNGVLPALVSGSEENLKIYKEFLFQFSQGDVGDIVFLFHKLHHTTVAAFIFLLGLVAAVNPYHLLGVLKKLLI